MILFNKRIGFGLKPLIVAEISCNHNQDFEKVERLMDTAQLSGADAVKIQYYEPFRMVPPSSDYKLDFGIWEGKNLYDLYSENATPHAWIEKIFEYGRKINIPVFSSVYDIYGLSDLEKLGCPAYKIASFEANDLELIERTLSTNKPVIISLGLVDDTEINKIVDLASKYNNSSRNLALLHCVSNYPAAVEEAALQRIRILKQFCPGITVGYSDHTCNPLVPALAVTMGASIIEAHIRLQGVYSEDVQFSYLPDDFATMVHNCKIASVATPVFPHTKGYPDYWRLKRSLYVTKPMKKGDIFTSDNVGSYRPAQGLSPALLPNVLGKKAKLDIDIWTPLKMEYVE